MCPTIKGGVHKKNPCLKLYFIKLSGYSRIQFGDSISVNPLFNIGGMFKSGFLQQTSRSFYFFSQKYNYDPQLTTGGQCVCLLLTQKF